MAALHKVLFSVAACGQDLRPHAQGSEGGDDQKVGHSPDPRSSQGGGGEPPQHRGIDHPEQNMRKVPQDDRIGQLPYIVG